MKKSLNATEKAAKPWIIASDPQLLKREKWKDLLSELLVPLEKACAREIVTPTKTVPRA